MIESTKHFRKQPRLLIDLTFGHSVIIVRRMDCIGSRMSYSRCEIVLTVADSFDHHRAALTYAAFPLLGYLFVQTLLIRTSTANALPYL